MLVIKQKMIYRADIRANQHLLYLFGDNLERKGTGGQAKEMRGEPNSFGIATKRRATHNPDDYFYDSDPTVMPTINEEFTRLLQHVRASNFAGIVIPIDGIGTGLAKLHINAPCALEFIEGKLKLIEHPSY